MALNNFTFEISETQYDNSNSNPLMMVIDENIPIRAVSEDIIDELKNPEKAISEDFLNYINVDEPEDFAPDHESFPNNEDILNLFNDEFSVDANYQESIENFNEGLFERIEEVEKVSSKEIFIEGLDEYLQVPSVIAFQISPKVQDDIPMTVVDHSNYTQLETCSEIEWQFRSLSYSQSSSPSSYSQESFSHSSLSGYSSPNSSSYFASSEFSSSSSCLKKRGRKPKQWKNEDFHKEYLGDAKSHIDELKRRNNISSGLYRQRKTETIEKMEAEIVIEKIKKVSLKKEHKKLKKQIKKLHEKFSLFMAAEKQQQYSSVNSNAIFTNF